MRLKFREKTYVITLALFLLFFNCGIFGLAFYSYKTNMGSAEVIAEQEFLVINEGFCRDCEYIKHSAVDVQPSQYMQLMKTYGEFYAPRGVHLAFYEGEEVRFSNLPDGIFIQENQKTVTQKANGARYLVINRKSNNGKYFLCYAKDVSYLDEDYFNICIGFVCASIIISVFFAVCLYWKLKKLFKPMDRLRVAAKEIADGDFSSRADEKGNDELSLLAADFNRMAAVIEQQMKALEQENKIKQRMLDNLAHEMRTPLTSIRGYAEYLLNANITKEEKKESLDFIISEAEQLKNISDHLLDEAFLRENKINLTKNDVSKMIIGVVKKFSVSVLESDIKIYADVKGDITLNCDKLLIELLLCNLVSNAINACRGKGTVLIVCEKKDNAVVLSVSDNGIGMTQEQIAHITEPFYRVDKSRSRNEGGTGLGLSLCKRIAESHQAKLEFDSAMGVGTKVIVTFTKP